jgi:two-component system, NarL family, sensor histidine kinase UhpB
MHSSSSRRYSMPDSLKSQDRQAANTAPAASLSSTQAPAASAALQAEWLTAVLQGSFSEVYAIECDSLRLLYMNPAAHANLQYPQQMLGSLTLLDIAGSPSEKNYREILQPLRHGTARQITLDVVLTRQDGTSYPVELRLLLSALGPTPVFIAIANDLSARYQSARALRASEARFRAIVSNTPGLVYQFLRQPDGNVTFPYLSDGCYALLGVSAERLCADSALFLQLVLPEDRPSWLESMAASAAELKAWNWEGRIWIEAWKDIKWINLRGTPRALDGGLVQWEGIMANITESKLERAEIERSRAQLAELSAHVEQVKEQERTRIAREVHDDLGGNLTAIKMALALLRRRLPPGDAQLIEKAAYLDLLVDRTFESAHRISCDLRPGVLDFGIITALEWQAAEFEKHLGIRCIFLSAMSELDLHPDHAVALFRIFQEALTNIGKHAHASQVSVHLGQSGECVQLEITDNGCGIAATDRLKPNSFGIRGMVERASALGGELTVGAAAGGGSIVIIRIPWPAPALPSAPSAPVAATPAKAALDDAGPTNSSNVSPD